MKKQCLFVVVLFFCLIEVFTETKINTAISIRYSGGAFAPMDSPDIDMGKVKKSKGKVFVRYDFEIANSGMLDSSYVYICLRFPDKYNLFTDMFGFVKITTIADAYDLTSEVAEKFIKTDKYSEIQNSVGRLPKIKWWYIAEGKNKRIGADEIDSFVGVPLKMKNKKGNKASIEFYLDFNRFYEIYANTSEREILQWLESLCHEIPIDVTFHNSFLKLDYSIPDDEYVKNYGYDLFQINVDNSDTWKNYYSKSNRSFTFTISD